MPSHVSRLTLKRPTAAASGNTVANRSFARGPCTASTARSCVVS